jgi:hypothetical protein
MGIFNRRNAVVGWLVWNVGKRVAKRKAKAAVPTIDAETKRPNKPAAVLTAALATLGGFLMLKRKKTPPTDE